MFFYPCQIESSEEIEKVSTSEERQSFIAKLEEVNPILYVNYSSLFFDDINSSSTVSRSKIGCIWMGKMLQPESLKSVLIC